MSFFRRAEAGQGCAFRHCLGAKATGRRRIGLNNLPLRIHHQRRPRGLIQPGRHIIRARESSGGKDGFGRGHVSQFGEGSPRLLEKLQNKIFLPVPVHFGQVRDEFDFLAVGKTQL